MSGAPASVRTAHAPALGLRTVPTLLAHVQHRAFPPFPKPFELAALLSLVAHPLNAEEISTGRHDRAGSCSSGSRICQRFDAPRSPFLEWMIHLRRGSVVAYARRRACSINATITTALPPRRYRTIRGSGVVRNARGASAGFARCPRKVNVAAPGVPMS